MRAAIAEVTDQPVKYVVYSHQHWDHVLGGQIFKEEGAEFISHDKCIPHFVRHPNDDLVMPDRVIPGDSEITLGGKTLKLMYFGPNHGDCMLVMQVEGTDILYINDLVTPYSVGLGFMPDYDPGEWVRTLHELEALDGWTHFIGGHGIPIAPKEALVQRRRYMEALMTAVRDGIAEGKRLEELYDTIELAQEFQEMRGYDTHIRRGAERIYHFYTMGW
jgi:glyoxylase-like metal-dependent hydrolase (beta-lactamase superfamily II)